MKGRPNHNNANMNKFYFFLIQLIIGRSFIYGFCVGHERKGEHTKENDAFPLLNTKLRVGVGIESEFYNGMYYLS